MYQLLDSGHGQKWERFGAVTLIRPCPQAEWNPVLDTWDKADAFFTPQQGWVWHHPEPSTWEVTLENIRFSLSCRPGGQIGIFPEQMPLWKKLQAMPVPRVLNLFGYSGGSSLAAALAGAQVTHVDASKAMIKWAQANATLNQVSLRTLVDDVAAYCARAQRRGDTYEGIILDPPTFGRGAGGQLFAIDRDLLPLLQQCQALHAGGYLLLSCHTPHYTPDVLQQCILKIFPKASVETGVMKLMGPQNITTGAYVFAYF